MRWKSSTHDGRLSHVGPCDVQLATQFLLDGGSPGPPLVAHFFGALQKIRVVRVKAAAP